MLQKKKILIVEDNQLNRAMLCEILADRYDVAEAENGLEALNFLKQSKDSIALVLLDIVMPVMDGYAFLGQVQQYPDLALIPVIVMAQNNSVQDEMNALSHGAIDFVSKPYHPDVLLHRVANIIKLRETAALVNRFRYDRLTGLYSKEYFYQKVQETLLENPEEEYSIVCSNIENFKLFNDIFGTQAGDSLLKEVADITKRAVANCGFCGRFGADRLLCLQTRKQEQQDRQNFRQAGNFEPAYLLKKVVMRWGVYEITDRSIPVEQMCDRAMLAATSIKGKYNQFFAVYDDSLRLKLLREREITAATETALAEKQFQVYFQPKYSLNGEYIAGAEALARWTHPTLGFISPGEFIPLFEKNGFIPRLDQYIWKQVCARLRDWQNKGYQPVPVSVNVSRADVYQLNLVDTLLAITQKYGVDPSYLHLEITESAYVDNTAKIFSIVDQLRKQGFVIEMDDFGSGYSSLNALSQMKLDVLKLDIQFIQNEIAKSAEKSILNDIITMAHRMHLSVVAEGVETQDQMDRLREVGCDYVQGYYFSKPLPAQEFEELLKSQPARPLEDTLAAPRHEANLPILLVVDEDAGYREQIRQNFAEQYRVLEAADMQSALDCIRGCVDASVSVVMLSMTLPEDGASKLMRVLRQEPQFWRIPILAMIPDSESTCELQLAEETDDFLCKRHPMFDLTKRVRRLTDMAAFYQREIALKDEAQRDPLTGVFNRRGLQAAFATLRDEDLPLAVCLFDLDNMKKVNDTLGHEAGDQMLSSFADVLRSQTRASDIRCRYGGDEFLVVLRHMVRPAGAVEKCNDICKAFQSFLTANDFPASCSSGIIMYTDYAEPLPERIAQADRALYRAKRENRGGCCLWNAREDG